MEQNDIEHGRRQKTRAPCEAFSFANVEEAFAHMRKDGFEKIRDFGDYQYGHYLHTWDDGYRVLVKCRSCGGYILIQSSEYHGFDDDYYTDYFPVSSEEEADELNRKYSGYAIEFEFKEKYLRKTNGDLSWSK